MIHGVSNLSKWIPVKSDHNTQCYALFVLICWKFKCETLQSVDTHHNADDQGYSLIPEILHLNGVPLPYQSQYEQLKCDHQTESIIIAPFYPFHMSIMWISVKLCSPCQSVVLHGKNFGHYTQSFQPDVFIPAMFALLTSSSTIWSHFHWPWPWLGVTSLAQSKTSWLYFLAY